MRETVGASELSVDFYQTTQRNISEYSHYILSVVKTSKLNFLETVHSENSVEDGMIIWKWMFGDYTVRGDSRYKTFRYKSGERLHTSFYSHCCHPLYRCFRLQNGKF
jgi:hypothetical protein